MALSAIILFGSLGLGLAQTQVDETGSPEARLVKDILHDQQPIWTSPVHTKHEDLRWLIPFVAAGAALIATDDHTSKALTYSSEQLSASHAVSTAGFGVMMGSVGALYLDGRLGHNQSRLRTGLMAGEAVADSEIVASLLKLATNRRRPDAPGSDARFWTGGKSFPSGHAIAVWSAASVLSRRYPGNHWLQFGVYGLAASTSFARYTGHEHYLSDVAVGGMVGYLIGRYVTRHR